MEQQQISKAAEQEQTEQKQADGGEARQEAIRRTKRNYMLEREAMLNEKRLGADISAGDDGTIARSICSKLGILPDAVRVSTGDPAATDAIGVEGYSANNEVVLGRDTEGRRAELIAHELTHIAQQNNLPSVEYSAPMDQPMFRVSAVNMQVMPGKFVGVSVGVGGGGKNGGGGGGEEKNPVKRKKLPELGRLNADEATRIANERAQAAQAKLDEFKQQNGGENFNAAELSEEKKKEYERLSAADSTNKQVRELREKHERQVAENPAKFDTPEMKAAYESKLTGMIGELSGTESVAVAQRQVDQLQQKVDQLDGDDNVEAAQKQKAHQMLASAQQKLEACKKRADMEAAGLDDAEPANDVEDVNRPAPPPGFMPVSSTIVEMNTNATPEERAAAERQKEIDRHGTGFKGWAKSQFGTYQEGAEDESTGMEFSTISMIKHVATRPKGQRWDAFKSAFIDGEVQTDKQKQLDRARPVQLVNGQIANAEDRQHAMYYRAPEQPQQDEPQDELPQDEIPMDELPQQDVQPQDEQPQQDVQPQQDAQPQDEQPQQEQPHEEQQLERHDEQLQHEPQIEPPLEPPLEQQPPQIDNPIDEQQPVEQQPVVQQQSQPRRRRRRHRRRNNG